MKLCNSKIFCNSLHAISCASWIICIIYHIKKYGIGINVFFDEEKGIFPILFSLMINIYIIIISNKYWNIFYNEPHKMFVKDKKTQVYLCKFMKISSPICLLMSLYIWKDDPFNYSFCMMACAILFIIFIIFSIVITPEST